MSGVETVLGLVCGAFPLIISAMEHYEDVKKPTMIWWKIRRAHRRDYGKVKDCQLSFVHQLELLLCPLLDDDVVDHTQYEQLLANPGGEGWQQSQVDEALAARLSTRHSRYSEILREMAGAMDKLCKATRVDDPQFQQLLEDRTNQAIAPGVTRRAQTSLMIRANVNFQGKRLKYSLTELRRDELLRDVEDYIGRLRNLLSASNELSSLSRTQKRLTSRPVSPKVLNFWRHADNIFRLLRDVWHCNCRSHACLSLQQNYAKATNIRIHMRFCHGGQSLMVKLSDTPPTIQISGAQKKPVTGYATSGGSMSPGPSTNVTNVGQSVIADLRVSSQQSQQSTTFTVMTRSAVTAALSVVSSSSTVHDLLKDGLCKVFSTAPPNDICVGTLVRDVEAYDVYPTAEALSLTTSTTLASAMQSNNNPKFTRFQRYGIALALASSQLQLQTSSWLEPTWTAESVHFPVSIDSHNVATIHGEPYLRADFDTLNGGNHPQRDRSFSTLGIVLLELCFGVRLEQHGLWQNPVYAAGKTDPLLRQTVACEWLNDVEDEAGGDYALAVSWTLKQAPAVLKDEKWRIEFAENVVQPLQACYESMKRGRIST
ncbi:hypothetical protein LTR85_011565 [Meristemomyces frigidus]|nr:hypothetical protein LTR85_011565 [Meristemomyces frigidus]